MKNKNKLRKFKFEKLKKIGEKRKKFEKKFSFEKTIISFF